MKFSKENLKIVSTVPCSNIPFYNIPLVEYFTTILIKKQTNIKLGQSIMWYQTVSLVLAAYVFPNLIMPKIARETNNLSTNHNMLVSFGFCNPKK